MVSSNKKHFVSMCSLTCDKLGEYKGSKGRGGYSDRGVLTSTTQSLCLCCNRFSLSKSNRNGIPAFMLRETVLNVVLIDICPGYLYSEGFVSRLQLLPHAPQGVWKLVILWSFWTCLKGHSVIDLTKLRNHQNGSVRISHIFSVDLTSTNST